MFFNSYIFIFLFLPIALIGYYFLNRIKKYSLAKLFLVVMSLWFYAYFHVPYLFIIVCSVGVNYLCHLALLRYKYKKLILTGGILLNVGVLVYFKYFDFMLTMVNKVLHSEFSVMGILLPLGISFFTFQQVAFLVDTMKGEAEKQSLLDYMLFVTFFPQLSSGPIVNQSEMLPQYKDLSRKSFSAEAFYHGLRFFILGLSKKVLLADMFGKATAWGFEYYESLGAIDVLLLILFYTFQIYFDFSGYSDMTVGIGYMFRIQFPVNFLSPYKAKNIAEFWERWHITLTRFFTRYIYIPLGGSRNGLVRTYLNVMIIFLISGIWHGAGMNFILWGLIHGVLMVGTRSWLAIKKKYNLQLKQKILHKLAEICSVAATFGCVGVAWLFFKASSVEDALRMLQIVIKGPWGTIYEGIPEFFRWEAVWQFMGAMGLQNIPYISYIFVAGYIAVAFVLIFICKNVYETKEEHKPGAIYTLFLAALFMVCVLSLSEVSSFIYTNF